MAARPVAPRTITPVAIGRENARLFPEYLARDGGGGGGDGGGVVEQEEEGGVEGGGGGGGGALEWHEYSGDDHELGAHSSAFMAQMYVRHTDFLKRHAE